MLETWCHSVNKDAHRDEDKQKISRSLPQANVKSSLSLSKHIVSEVTNLIGKPSEDKATQEERNNVFKLVLLLSSDTAM